MNKYKILFSVFITLLGLKSISAQQVYSSQFYAMPIYLNPALTGNSDYNIRAGVNYRNQWNSVTTPFVSQAAYVDGKLGFPYLGASWLGVGGVIFTDKAGTGGLKTNQVMLTTSLNKSLNKGNTLFFHGGLGVELVNKSVDYNKLVFGDQWDGEIFGDPTEELPETQSLFYLDISLGGAVTYFRAKTKYFFGVAVSHINQPNESFYEITNNLKRSYNFHGGLETKLSPRIYIKPQFLYKDEVLNTEFMLGANCSMEAGKKGLILYYGLWYRNKEDIIPTVGFLKKRFKFILSYDVDVSALKTTSASKGGLEISLTYNYNYSNSRDLKRLERKKKSKKLGTKAISCPKFTNED
ncbi:PorP/SprF family type IX secretion system membrane protein [Ancylomarina sp. 16SWW S1-10-2]|uniref:PorP/SprF family type IX secretion system membrane protein n=1 Tax=Ancylomarina sp. 16SWW S1-10-2 TaxID=2499681 RepID=UPI00189FD7D5|nr:PorP/SprF family type IX secretion system membrane protein [Ancylomarina sp. 16SWW S1-10-2]